MNYFVKKWCFFYWKSTALLVQTNMAAIKKCVPSFYSNGDGQTRASPSAGVQNNAFIETIPLPAQSSFRFCRVAFKRDEISNSILCEKLGKIVSNETNVRVIFNDSPTIHRDPTNIRETFAEICGALTRFPRITAVPRIDRGSAVF